MDSQKTRQSIEQEIRVKSLRDAEFRQQLLVNPKSAIEAAMGIDIPETLEIKVMEETDKHLILTVPAALPETADELSEEQLEAVAGGVVRPDFTFTTHFSPPFVPHAQTIQW